MMGELHLKIRQMLDRIRRKVAYVPAVEDTVKSLKNLGVDLRNDSKGK
ncbi:hypothetical protein OMCYN_01814 [cyanobiont of Ornithocercus magnificus]|nr:hypothetical protein OMCYN_01814 [cyanobiont of Ornithocercus magnificus]